MSWSVATRVHPASKIRSAIEHAQPTADMSEAQAEQMRRAKQAAIGMLDEAIAGDANEETSDLAFRVQLHGHVAPEGEGALPSTTIVLEQMPADLAEDYDVLGDGGTVREVGEGEPDPAEPGG